MLFLEWPFLRRPFLGRPFWYGPLWLQFFDLLKNQKLYFSANFENFYFVLKFLPNKYLIDI